jgi:hypothetical protein
VKLQSPIMRELHWFNLLSGQRRNDVATLGRSDVSVREQAVAPRESGGGRNFAFERQSLRRRCDPLPRSYRRSRYASNGSLPPSCSRHEEIRARPGSMERTVHKRKILRLSKVGHSLIPIELYAAIRLDRPRTKLDMNHQVSREMSPTRTS